MNKITKWVFIIPAFLIGMGIVAAEVESLDLNVADQVDMQKALSIADKIPYVRDFGAVQSIELANDNGKTVWDIVELNDAGNVLHVWVDPETEAVIKVESQDFSGLYTAPNVRLSHEQLIEQDYLKYGLAYEKSTFDYKVRLTENEAIQIANRVPVIQDAGAVDMSSIKLINDHGILMWQFLKEDSNGEPTMVVWVHARDGIVMRAESSLVDIFQAEMA